MGNSGRSKKALVLDDDQEFINDFSSILTDFKIQTESTSVLDKFLDLLKNRQYEFCLIDFNRDQVSVLCAVIKTIRASLGNVFPIFVSSYSNDRKLLAHAIEVGANDCFLKPIDREILATKVSKYLNNPELLKYQLSFFPVPNGYIKSELIFDCNIVEIDEFGIVMACKHLIPKGTTVRFKAELSSGLHLEEINGVAFKAMRSWINPDRISFGYYLEFDQDNQLLMSAVRRYVAENGS